MAGIKYCPIIGKECNKSEHELRVQMNTFFLAHPFEPEIDKKRRESAVKIALKEALQEDFSETSLRVADKEPKDPSIFCDICRLIQVSAYGIVDISGLNPNVLLEMGMMFSLGKPVFVLVKKSEKDSLGEKLPSDIVWKRVIPYEEAIEIIEELSKQIQSRPIVEPSLPLGEEAKKVFAEVDSNFAEQIDTKLQEIKREQKERLGNLEKLLRDARLTETILPKKELHIPDYLEKQIDKLHEKVERIEKLVGSSKDPDVILSRGNWHYHRKQYDKALESYDLALDLNPNSEVLWINKGIVLHELERYEEAIVCYDKVIGIKPDHESAWNNKGVSLAKLERYEEAIVCYDKVIGIKPDHEKAWYNKGNDLGKLGRWKEAKSCYEEALRIDANDLSTLVNLSEALLIMEDFAKGLEIAEKALGLAEESSDKTIAWYLCICAYLFKGETEKAQKEMEELVKYLRTVEKGFKVIKWTFSPLLPTIENKLEEKSKRKLLSLISLLKGEIDLTDWMKKE